MCDKFIILASIYLVAHGCAQVQDGVILALEDEKIESIIRNLFNCKSFICREGDVTLLSDQGGFPIEVSQYSIYQESDMFNLNSNQTSAINSVFIDKYNDSGAYLPVDFLKAPIFGIPPSESIGTCQEVKAL